MSKPILTLLLTGLLLAGCSGARESNLNPFNWFSTSTSTQTVDTEATGAANPLIPQRRNNIFFGSEEEQAYIGVPIAEVRELALESRPGGAILRTSGLSARPRAFDVRLTVVAEQTGNGVLTFDFEAIQRAGPLNASPAQRTLTTALWLTEKELRGIREVRVRSASNVRSVRR